MDELWPDLLDLGFASPADEARLPAFRERLGARPVDFRAALRASRRCTPDELRDAVGEILAVLH